MLQAKEKLHFHDSSFNAFIILQCPLSIPQTLFLTNLSLILLKKHSGREPVSRAMMVAPSMPSYLNNDFCITEFLQ